MKAFIKFWKDLWSLYKETGKWYKNHWFGYIIMCLVMWGLAIGWIFKRDILDWAEEKINKVLKREPVVE